MGHALAPYTIFYQPRTAIKSQALADFLVDWAETQYLPPAPDSTHWEPAPTCALAWEPAALLPFGAQGRVGFAQLLLKSSVGS